jgi:hypothetical protein
MRQKRLLPQVLSKCVQPPSADYESKPRTVSIGLGELLSFALVKAHSSGSFRPKVAGSLQYYGISDSAGSAKSQKALVGLALDRSQANQFRICHEGSLVRFRTKVLDLESDSILSCLFAC